MTLEFRVWVEDGTLLGYATLNDAGVFEVGDAPANSGYRWDGAWINKDESYGREWAEGLADWAREICDCDGFDCGVMSEHGVSVQECYA